MTINLITQEEYKELILIQENHPILTFQNDGYKNFDKSKMTEEDRAALTRVSEILKDSIKGFSEFNNFKYEKESNVLKIRFQYDWTADSLQNELPFIGVGYLELQELFNGFKKK